MPLYLVYLSESVKDIGAWSLTFKDALPFLTALVAGLFGWFGALLSQTAPLQASLNDAFRTAMGQWQTERAQLIARGSELEAEIIRQRGMINQGLAREAAMLRLLEKNNVSFNSGEGI